MEEITAIIYAEGKRFSATAASYDALLDGGQNITCILQAESDEITLGQSYTLCGQWKRNPRFGNQFHAQSFLESAPISPVRPGADGATAHCRKSARAVPSLLALRLISQ